MADPRIWACANQSMLRLDHHLVTPVLAEVNARPGGHTQPDKRDRKSSGHNGEAKWQKPMAQKTDSRLLPKQEGERERTDHQAQEPIESVLARVRLLARRNPIKRQHGTDEAAD